MVLWHDGEVLALLLFDFGPLPARFSQSGPGTKEEWVQVIHNTRSAVHPGTQCVISVLEELCDFLDLLYTSETTSGNTTVT